MWTLGVLACCHEHIPNCFRKIFLSSKLRACESELKWESVLCGKTAVNTSINHLLFDCVCVCVCVCVHGCIKSVFIYH